MRNIAPDKRYIQSLQLSVCCNRILTCADGYVKLCKTVSLQWRHDGHDSVSNHQPHDCLLNRLFRRGSKKTSKLRITDLCAGNSPGTGEFPAQMASNAENVSIWWRHHVNIQSSDNNLGLNLKNLYNNILTPMKLVCTSNAQAIKIIRISYIDQFTLYVQFGNMLRIYIDMIFNYFVSMKCISHNMIRKLKRYNRLSEIVKTCWHVLFN